MTISIDSWTADPNPVNDGGTTIFNASWNGAVGAIGYGLQDLEPFTDNPSYAGLAVTVNSQVSVDFYSSGGYKESDSVPVNYGGGEFSISFSVDTIDSISVFCGLKDQTNAFVAYAVLEKSSSRVASYTFGSYSGLISYNNASSVEISWACDGIDTATVTISDLGGVIFSQSYTVDVGLINSMHLELATTTGTANVRDYSFIIGCVTTYSIKNGAVEKYNGSTIEDSISVPHTAELSEDSSSWVVDVANAGDTVSSGPIILSVEEACTMHPIDEYRIRLNMSMDILDGWNDTIVIFDDGSTADTYTTHPKYYSDEFAEWARPESNDPAIVLSSDGFLPFGPHFSGDQTGWRYPVYNRKLNFHGDYQGWDVEMIPDSSGGYTYNTTAYSPCSVTGFTFSGVENIPMPECRPVSEYSIQYGRAGKVVREYDRGLTTEHRRFEMSWRNITGEELRAILVQLITVIRGNSFDVNFYSGFNRFSPWVPRSGESTVGVQKLRLVSPVIEYNNTGGDNWDLTIEVMKWEE